MREFTEPIGKLRLLQVFGDTGPLCDCGCLGRSIGLWGDDERTGFALAFACAGKRGCLEEWKPIAEKVKSMNIGQSFSLRLPKWKEGSELQWRQDIPVLLSRLGAINNFGCSAGKDEIKFYIPAPTQGQMQRNAAVGKR